MATPWKSSDELVAMVKRKISLPVSQITFTDNDIIAFLNEELMTSQVPTLLQYHNEYYVYKVTVPLEANKTRYSIPDRAIGMRLRDIKYVDTNGSIFNMTQIPADDKSVFQRSNESVYMFYIEGNDIVLTMTTLEAPSGSLALYIYLRPNQLVANSRAGTVTGFTKTIQISDNSTIGTSNTIILNGVTFAPVLSSPGTNQFLIGVTASATATNLASAISASSLSSYITAAASTDTVTITSSSLNLQWTVTNSACYTFTNHNTVVLDLTPTNITSSSLVDLLQTRPGHRIYDYDVIPVSVSTSSIVLNDSDMSLQFMVGDYICEQNESIIPYLPPDLHNGLAERACARILAAQGDQAGLAAVNQKIQEIDQQTNRIIADRSESTPLKLNARGSLLRWTRMGNRGSRRF